MIETSANPTAERSRTGLKWVLILITGLAIIGLGRSLNIATTAEGVELEEQYVLLRTAGCGFGQGYLFGRPTAHSNLVLTAPDNLDRSAVVA